MELSSGQQFRQPRSAGNRSGATSAQKPRLSDSAILHARAEPQNISTDWVADFHVGRGILQLSHIPRILKMVENLSREHFSSMKPAGCASNPSRGSNTAGRSANIRFEPSRKARSPLCRVPWRLPARRWERRVLRGGEYDGPNGRKLSVAGPPERI